MVKQRNYCTFAFETKADCKMKIKFTIEYHTQWGENLYVSLTYLSADGSCRKYLLPMDTMDGAQWTLETSAVESRRLKMRAFRYHYEVRDADRNMVRREWCLVQRLMPFDDSRDYTMMDTWRDMPLQQHLFTNAFAVTRHMPLHQHVRALDTPLYRRTVLFRVHAPQLEEGQAVALCGSHPAIGGWSSSRYLLMSDAGQGLWQITVNADAFAMPIEYKYVIVDSKNHQLLKWEDGDNRNSGEYLVGEGKVLVLDGGMMRVKEDAWRVAGVALPLFALRSNQSFGCGDLHDLRTLIDWAAETGVKLIQLLPINDTTSTHGWTDSHPYNIISTHALHPHYLSLYDAGKLEDKQQQTAFERRRRELEEMKTYDYEAVARTKWDYLQQLFEQEEKTLDDNHEFQTFVKDNQPWLLPYVTFCLLRDKYGTSNYDEWQDYASYRKEQAAEYLKKHHRKAQLILFVQYLLFRQLATASAYAHEKGVALKGDLPVGVCRYSVDTWEHPEFFHLDTAAGTPPDSRNRYGQNWGFPTYNWQTIMQDGATWWHSRIAWMEQFFDAVRIDHIAGFFRMWQIPNHAVHATLGHFSPALAIGSGEIESMGLLFRRDFLTQPFINDTIIERTFGIHALFVKDNYLENKGYGLYSLKEEYNTQRKIESLFAGKNDENSNWIQEGLLRLVANVLLIPDNQDNGLYHPRTWAYREPVFNALSDEQQEAYMRIYRHYFNNRNNDFWCAQAQKKLEQIFADTRMLVCAEDLGAMPKGSDEVLDRLRMLTLEIQTLPKRDGMEFAPLGGNPIRSVATTTTHDMAPLRLWWEENPQLAQRYYSTMMQKEGRAPRTLPVTLAEEIIARHLYSPSMLCIFPIQDLLSMDAALTAGVQPHTERINMPGDCYNRWQYRMNVSIETLIHSSSFNQKLKTMILRSRRLCEGES